MGFRITGRLAFRIPRFPSSPLIIRVPFFLLFGFNKGTQKEKGYKGTTGEPRFYMGLGFRISGKLDL